MNAWMLSAFSALGALIAVYAYAAAALWTHARLSTLAPPRSLAHTLAIGALMPACGCTALAYARRAPERLRAPFLVAAYGVNPLLVIAGALLRGWPGAALVLALALAAALAARLLPPGERPRTRLDDLLLRRDARPLRDALPYTAAFALPALVLGALLGGLTLAPEILGALTIGALALLFAPRPRDVAEDHGSRFARGVFAIHAGFGLALAGAWLLAPA